MPAGGYRTRGQTPAIHELSRELKFVVTLSGIVSRLAAALGRLKNRMAASARYRFRAWIRERKRRRALRIDHPEIKECAIAIPFDYNPTSSSGGKVAVICHIYYPELAHEIFSYISRIPVPVDVFVSTDMETKKEAILQASSGVLTSPPEVRVAENRGRDILHKYVTCRDAHETHDLVLFLHSKESKHYDGGALWRRSMMESLIGSPKAVACIYELFSIMPELGVIFPEHHSEIRTWTGWGENFRLARKLASRMGITIRRYGALEFPSGSMFWARTAALRPILDLNLAPGDFAPEKGQEDGTLAHALERLVLFSAERAGYSWLKVTPEDGHQARRVGSPKELQRVARECATRLLPTHQRRPLRPALTSQLANPLGRARKKIRTRVRMAYDAHLASVPSGPVRVLHQILGRRPETVPRFWVKEPNLCEGDNICLYAAYAAGNRVQAHSRDGARRWHQQGYKVVLITASDEPASLAIDEDLSFCSGILVRRNSGYDFGAWAAAILTIPELRGANIVALANDSVFGPFNTFPKFLERVVEAREDVVGVTDSYEIRHHIQSYAVFFKSSALANSGFWRFWRSVRSGGRSHAIRHYELLMMDSLSAAGLRLTALFPSGDSGSPSNPTLTRWRDLLESGYPFIKAQLLRENPLSADLTDWEEIVAAKGGDPSLIKRAIGAE